MTDLLATVLAKVVVELIERLVAQLTRTVFVAALSQRPQLVTVGAHAA